MSRFDHIKTLEELRLERMRINEKIAYKEENLRRRYSSFRNLLSIDGVVEYLSGSFLSMSSIIEYVYRGYEFITSLIKGRRKSYIDDKES